MDGFRSRPWTIIRSIVFADVYLGSGKVSFLILVFLGFGCGQKKVSDVFSESQGQNEKLVDPQCAAQFVEDRYIIQWEDGHYSTFQGPQKDEFIEKFLNPQIDQIKHVEFDKLIKIQPHQVSKTSAHNVRTTSLNPNLQWAPDMIEAPAVWTQGYTGTNVVVGVVDGYVDYQNNQLRSRILINSNEIPNNGIDDDHNGVVDDYYFGRFTKGALQNKDPLKSHGTHVAGIIAADPDAGPVVGIAPKSNIVSATFIDGERGEGLLSDAILAMQYVTSRGARIINASWGGPNCSKAVYDMFADLEKKNVLVVIAAGNESMDIDVTPDYPAAFDFSNQLTVAASTKLDYMPIWSNRGFKLVHLAAPGENINSTVGNNLVESYDGTSMAAPMVTGAAALLIGAYPRATPQQIRKALMGGVDITQGHEYAVNSGGRLNVRKALEILKKTILP